MQSGRGELAAVAIGAAAAMKGYPLIFAALFLGVATMAPPGNSRHHDGLSQLAWPSISYYGLHVGHALRLFHERSP